MNVWVFPKLDFWKLLNSQKFIKSFTNKFPDNDVHRINCRSERPIISENLINFKCTNNALMYPLKCCNTRALFPGKSQDAWALSVKQSAQRISWSWSSTDRISPTMWLNPLAPMAHTHATFNLDKVTSNIRAIKPPSFIYFKRKKHE